MRSHSDRQRGPIVKALLVLSVSACPLILVDMALDVITSFTTLSTGIGELWLLIADNEVSFFYRDQSGRLNMVFHRLGPTDANAPERFFEFNQTHVKSPGFELVAGTYAKSMNKGVAVGISYWVLLIISMLVAVWTFFLWRGSPEGPSPTGSDTALNPSTSFKSSRN